jgi:hypothetical protein
LPALLHVFAPPGVQTGAEGQEQLFQAQVALHVCVPYVLQVCIVVAAQAPWPKHVPSCHIPFTHVCVSVPQLVQGIGFVVPGAHAPEHAPEMHVALVHSAAVPHWPHASHV